MVEEERGGDSRKREEIKREGEMDWFDMGLRILRN